MPCGCTGVVAGLLAVGTVGESITGIGSGVSAVERCFGAVGVALLVVKVAAVQVENLIAVYTLECK